MLDDDAAKLEARYAADVPTKISALSSWPPRSGISWTRAIKDYRASEATDDVMWGCQGWVPTRDGVPAFIAGRQVIGPDGAGDERAQAGLTADEFPNIRSEEHTSELQSRGHLVCRLLLEKKKKHRTPKTRRSGTASSRITR